MKIVAYAVLGLVGLTGPVLAESPKLDLDAVNGGRQTPSTSFGSVMARGSGQVVSGAPVVGSSQTLPK